jgi:hypothetical protein
VAVDINSLPEAWKQFATEAGRPPTEILQEVASVPGAAKAKLTASEVVVAMDLVRRGMAAEDAMRAVLQQRALVESLQTPSGASVAGAVANRNRTGRW